jgi:hypothetical protein
MVLNMSKAPWKRTGRNWDIRNQSKRSAIAGMDRELMSCLGRFRDGVAKEMYGRVTARDE